MRTAVDSAANVVGVIAGAFRRGIDADATTFTAFMGTIKRSIYVRSGASLCEAPAALFSILDGRLNLFIGMSVSHDQCSDSIIGQIVKRAGRAPPLKSRCYTSKFR